MWDTIKEIILTVAAVVSATAAVLGLIQRKPKGPPPRRAQPE